VRELVPTMNEQSSQQVSWWPVYLFVQAAIAQAEVTDWPRAGTPSWCALADGDPRKLCAVLDDASHWSLRVDSLQEAQADAASAVSSAEDWPAVARRIRERVDFHKAKPWARRVSR
jgi:Protein of unknown function (DUF2742)